MNQAGFYFGPGSVVNAAGFVATTATTLPDSIVNGAWQFSGPPPAASIVNYGEIHVSPGGSAFLIAEKIENHGVLTAPDGTLGLYAGKEVTMSARPDGRGLSVRVRLPAGSIDNDGRLVADAGSILLQAQTVNQNGLIQANSVREHNGVIELVASDSANLGANSVISAEGDSTAQSSGGTITIKSDNSFTDATGSLITVAGGVLGGDGGHVEISALAMPAIHSTIDGRAAAGFTGGSLLIDPQDINIGTTGTGTAGGGVVGAGDPPTTLNLDVNSAFIGLSQIDLQARRNITILSGTAWDLAQSTGISGGSHLLSLEAGNNITFQAGASLQAGLGWSISLAAGRDFSSPDAIRQNVGNLLFQSGSALSAHDGSITLQAGNNITLQSGTTVTLDHSPGATSPLSLFSAEAGNNITLQGASIQAGQGWSASLAAGRDYSTESDITAGTGTILFQGAGSLQAMDGSIHLRAGQDVTVGSGFVRTMGGGNIDVSALAGSINTGTRQNGFIFLATDDITRGDYMQVDQDLGGISTGAGGNVNLTAGLDITSFLPRNSDTQLRATDAGSGAFGSAAGNVTITAGRDVIGHYVVRNGVGTIHAGHDAGTTFDSNTGSDHPLALSLVAGGWNVTAGQDIDLQEVRNPNGIFNNQGFTGRLGARHYFDYDPHAYVNLSAGNSVQLTGVRGSSLPRRNGSFEQSIPAIYAPSLSINAGAGGVLIGDDVILFASPNGQLNITTTGGGSLRGTRAGALVNLIMSDSGSAQYRPASNPNADFGAADHGLTAIHRNDSAPVTLNISGDIGPHSVTDPVGGLMLVFPKHAEINVGGNMVNSRFNIQNLQSSDVTVLNVAGDILNTVEFTGVSVATAPDFSLFARAVDTSLVNLGGKFSYDPQSHLLTFHGTMTSAEMNALVSLQVYALDPITQRPYLDQNGNPVTQTVSLLSASTALALFTATQNLPPSTDTGYTIQGPGTLNVTAHDLNLGDTTGIRSIGPADNHALARLGSSGSAINVNLTGDLDMFSTAIASLAGGNVTVNVAGSANLGNSVFTGDQTARGIFTVARSDVSVVAGGSININGSRIAAYDGGNVTVISLHGDVNAGQGGQGSVEVEEVYINPRTGEVLTYTPTIPGSGILATSFPTPLDPSFPSSTHAPGNITVRTPEGDIIANAGGIVQLALNGVDSRTSTINLEAGTVDDQGNVIHDGNINASGSGVIGYNVHMQAAGGVQGLIVAQHNIDISAQQNVNVTALGSGNVNVSSGGTISGTIVGVGSVNVSGATVDASMLSQGGVNANNASVGSSQAFTSANAAGSTSQSSAAGSEEQVKKAVVASNMGDQDDEKKKKGLGSGPVITRRTGRVTVILPKS